MGPTGRVELSIAMYTGSLIFHSLMKPLNGLNSSTRLLLVSVTYTSWVVSLTAMPVGPDSCPGPLPGPPNEVV